MALPDADLSMVARCALPSRDAAAEAVAGSSLQGLGATGGALTLTGATATAPRLCFGNRKTRRRKSATATAPPALSRLNTTTARATFATWAALSPRCENRDSSISLGTFRLSVIAQPAHPTAEENKHQTAKEEIPRHASELAIIAEPTMAGRSGGAFTLRLLVLAFSETNRAMSASLSCTEVLEAAGVDGEDTSQVVADASRPSNAANSPCTSFSAAGSSAMRMTGGIQSTRLFVSTALTKSASKPLTMTLTSPSERSWQSKWMRPHLRMMFCIMESSFQRS
mmetsp:Transcript_98121/g.277514  ORF Transcript_98121/g.277514 Transcript_98121/m.277514 type:complete len:282 (+) Transcript_98121:518-1363(+)